MDRQSIKIGVLVAGSDTEIAWAKKSARNVINVLRLLGFNNILLIKPEKTFILLPKCDVIFISVFGKPWQSGMAQSLCEYFNIPYTGSDIKSSFFAFNKHLAKKILEKHKISTPTWKYSNINTVKWDNAIQKIGNDVILKPVDEGLSKNVFLVKDKKKYYQAYKKIMKENQGVMIEKFIKGIEITVPVIRAKDVVVLPPIEIIKPEEIVNYIAMTKLKTKIYRPLFLDNKYINYIKNVSKECFVKLNCRGIGYVDMIFESKKLKPYVLEVGTIAGYTKKSKVPFSASLMNISLKELIELNILIALDKNFKIKKYLKNAS